MVEPSTPFAHEPDPVLGAALRRALEPADPTAFVARVVAQFEGARAPYWEVLAGWARLGIAAAVVAALLAGVVVGRALRAPTPFEEGLATPDLETLPAAVLLSSAQPPDASVLFATLVER